MTLHQISRHEKTNEYTKYKVGENLKQLRLARNMTQKFVASENGLSSGMISLIESNSISASISTLTKLMKFYGVKMSWLFDDNNENKKYQIIRKDERLMISKISNQNMSCNNGFFCESLSQLKQKKMQPYIITLSDDMVSDNFYIHYGESFMYVLKGAFDLALGGGGRVVLKEGDSVYLDASFEHRFHSKGGSEVTVLVVKAVV
ncbi:MAG: helix-turn-helix domain-containing protein [Geobacteraceae bacterium]|nr:helix-turn-helix domain-containing protein [Geobacteraceae bacterium]